MKRLFHSLVLLSFMVGRPAIAAVVYSGLQNIPITTNFDGVYLDIDNGVHSTSVITGWDINPFFGGIGIGASAAFQPARMGSGNMDTVLRFSLGDMIGGSLLYSSGETGSSDHLGVFGNFQDGVEGYLGFRFTKNDSSGPYYGWMRLTLTANTSGAFIQDWAWEDSGSAITILGIPEPSRALLLMATLGAICIRRRRPSDPKNHQSPAFLPR
jgi:hypothetical protein